MSSPVRRDQLDARTKPAIPFWSSSYHPYQSIDSSCYISFRPAVPCRPWHPRANAPPQSWTTRDPKPPAARETTGARLRRAARLLQLGTRPLSPARLSIMSSTPTSSHGYVRYTTLRGNKPCTYNATHQAIRCPDSQKVQKLTFACYLQYSCPGPTSPWTSSTPTATFTNSPPHPPSQTTTPASSSRKA